MVVLTTDRKAVQCVENVDSLFHSIKKYYQIKYQKSLNAEYGFSFGDLPVCEHMIVFSPFSGGIATLRLTGIGAGLIEKITGKTNSQIVKERKEIRVTEGNNAAFNFPKTFNESLVLFFHTESITLEIDEYGNKINMSFDIEILTVAILDAISEVLKHVQLVPKSQSTREYEL